MENTENLDVGTLRSMIPSTWVIWSRKDGSYSAEKKGCSVHLVGKGYRYILEDIVNWENNPY